MPQYNLLNTSSFANQEKNNLSHVLSFLVNLDLFLNFLFCFSDLAIAGLFLFPI